MLPRDLFLNFCAVTALTYLGSLSFRRAPISWKGPWNELRNGAARRVPWRALMASAAGALLMQFPAHLAGGLLVDLRTVPVALAALGYGWQGGLLAALPLAVYRAWLGGPGASAGVAILLGAALLVAPLRSADSAPANSGREAWPTRLWPALLGLGGAQLLGLPFLRDPAGFARSALPLVVVFNCAAFGAAWSILHGRFELLRLTDALREQAHTDPLTALPNRRQFDLDTRRFDHGDALAFSHLLLLDIDFFKRVNDTWGHDGGDQVLREVARALQAGVRQGDRVYRIGGEEFAVLLRGASSQHALLVAERLRRRVRQDVGAALPHLSAPVTLSGGMVALTETPDLAEAQRRADALLYDAKRGGRDQVCGLAEDISPTYA